MRGVFIEKLEENKKKDLSTYILFEQRRSAARKIQGNLG